MNEENSLTIAWVRLGAVTCLAAALAYPAMMLLPIPIAGSATLASSWGPLLGVATIGLSKLLQIQRRSLAAQLAAIFNFMAGALVVTMLLVQMAVHARLQPGTKAPAELVSVWLGLDVAWDIYICIGTILLAIAMLRHPRFRAPFAVSGLILAGLLLVLNLATFPTPPAEAHLIDLGPLCDLWYLAVGIQALRSVRWAAEALGQAPAARADSSRAHVPVAMEIPVS